MRWNRSPENMWGGTCTQRTGELEHVPGKHLSWEVACFTSFQRYGTASVQGFAPMAQLPICTKRITAHALQIPLWHQDQMIAKDLVKFPEWKELQDSVWKHIPECGTFFALQESVCAADSYGKYTVTSLSTDLVNREHLIGQVGAELQ